MKEIIMIVVFFAVMSILTACNVKDGIDGTNGIDGDDAKHCIVQTLEDEGIYTYHVLTLMCSFLSNLERYLNASEEEDTRYMTIMNTTMS